MPLSMGNEPFPNNAIYISLEPKSDKMKKNIEFIIKRNRGWGFQRAQLTYDLDLDMLVLPCSWFDGGWIENPYNLARRDIIKRTLQKYDFDTFFKGAFCYHGYPFYPSPPWNSIAAQLIKLIEFNMGEVNLLNYSLYLFSFLVYSKTIQAPKNFFAHSLKPRIYKMLVQINVKKS